MLSVVTQTLFALNSRRMPWIDLDERYLRQARWAALQFGLESRTTFKKMQVYDLAHYNPGDQSGFDLVLFMGVLYHLRYPMLGMDIVAQKVRRLMVFQTLSMFDKELATTPYDLDIFDGDTVVALTDVTVDNETGQDADVFTLRDGKTVRVQVHTDTALMERVYGKKQLAAG